MLRDHSGHREELALRMLRARQHRWGQGRARRTQAGQGAWERVFLRSRQPYKAQRGGQAPAPILTGRGGGRWGQWGKG